MVGVVKWLTRTTVNRIFAGSSPVIYPIHNKNGEITMDSTKIIVSYSDLNESQIENSINSVGVFEFKKTEKIIGTNFCTVLIILAMDNENLSKWHQNILEFIKRHDEFEGDFYSFVSEIYDNDFLVEPIMKNDPFIERLNLYSFEFQETDN